MHFIDIDLTFTEINKKMYLSKLKFECIQNIKRKE